MIKPVKMKHYIIAISTIMVMGCSSTYDSDAPQVSSDGLDLKRNTRSTLAYKKADINFAEYDKVQISPSTVAFKKNWQRDYNRNTTSLSSRIRDTDVTRIKTSVAELLDEVFKEEFANMSSFSLVEKATVGTLLIKPSIINLDVNAPDVMSATRSRTYTEETGSATLFLEIYDAVSGEILVRVLDAETAGDNGFYQWSSRVSNRADAKRVIRKWAKTLRTKFDQVHAK